MGALRTRILSCLIACTLCLFAGSLYQSTRPNFGPSIAEFSDKTIQQPYPLLLKKAPKTKFLLKQYLGLGNWYPTVFQFYPQDFLWAIKVNGHEVIKSGLPLSSVTIEGRSINLAPYLHPGLNEIQCEMEVKWGEAALQMYVSPWDMFSLILAVVITAAICGTAVFFCSILKINVLSSEVLIILAGTLLRYIYLLGTPYFIRSFDSWGHVDYLDYVIRTLSLPPAHSNWESFQPPLYYIFLAGMTKFFLLCGMPEPQRYVLWQGVAFLFSVGVLAAGYRISYALYRDDRRGRIYLLAVLAAAPPLVFNAARISNDCLVTLLEFLWLAVLLHFWSRPTKAGWLGLSIIVGFALLTKANALILVPISAACLLLNARPEMRIKAFYLTLLVAVSLGIAGGYYLVRATQESAASNMVVGNLVDLNPKSHIEGVFVKSLIFNPFKLVRYPFDEFFGPRRDYFLEVLFKTMLLGGWIKGASYKFCARMILLTGLLLLPFLALGVYRAIRGGTARMPPLLVMLGMVFIAQWTFLQMAPFLATQDFRFSVILLVPLLYYLLQGVDYCSRSLRSIAEFVLQLLIINAVAYILALSLGS
jgi:hypothetical protein